MTSDSQDNSAHFAGRLDDCELSPEARHYNALVDSLSTYTYPFDQHKAAEMHAKTVQKLGGVVYLSFDNQDSRLRLTPIFAKEVIRFQYNDFMRKQGILQKELTTAANRPISAFVRAASLAELTVISSCSYHVAPKSISEDFKLMPTFFAALGALTVAHLLYSNLCTLPTRKKMYKTASSIIDGNKPILQEWHDTTPWHMPK